MSINSDVPSILHVDMDAFFASVEALKNPELRNKPLIVGGVGARGVVASCSYEARFYGVRSAMPSYRAKRLCPKAIFVNGQYHLYVEYSEKMHKVFEDFTPLVEGISLDEAFLDVSGATRLFGTPEEIAHQIRNRLIEELGLSASVGVATTKHIAKLASVAAKPRATKTGPADAKGVVVVREEEVIDFLHPMPVRALWGVGPATAARLEKLGVNTVGELAKLSVDQLVSAVGNAAGNHLHNLAWNKDFREVEPQRAMKSVGHEQTYAIDLTTRDEIHHQLVRLAEAVSHRLRKGHVVGRSLAIKVRYASFETITRSKVLVKPTANSATLLKTADEIAANVEIKEGIRLLGLSVSDLREDEFSEQLSFDDFVQEDELKQLDAVVDRIRELYGEEAVVPAPLLSPGSGLMRRGDQQWGPGSEVARNTANRGRKESRNDADRDR